MNCGKGVLPWHELSLLHCSGVWSDLRCFRLASRGVCQQWIGPLPCRPSGRTGSLVPLTQRPHRCGAGGLLASHRLFLLLLLRPNNICFCCCVCVCVINRAPSATPPGYASAVPRARSALLRDGVLLHQLIAVSPAMS